MHIAKTPDGVNYTIVFQEANEAQAVLDQLAILLEPGDPEPSDDETGSTGGN